jgi:hypothetical protein
MEVRFLGNYKFPLSVLEIANFEERCSGFAIPNPDKEDF